MKKHLTAKIAKSNCKERTEVRFTFASFAVMLRGRCGWKAS
jgi:hypothetical protein